MKIGNIYYLIPDIFTYKFEIIPFLRSIKNKETQKYINKCINGHHRPIGGIKVHYQHCQQLLEEGFNAYPLVLGKYDGNFYDNDIVTKHIKDVGYELHENDVVVSTEFLPYEGLDFKNCIKVLFMQNPGNIHRRKKAEDRYASYRSLGYDHVISCGDYITEVVNYYNNEECISINNGIDSKIFFRDDTIREENRVICLPRKHPDDLETIKRIVKLRVPNVNFIDVDGVTELEIAKEFRKSDIYLATGYPEGLPLPPMEAMFSGCVVVGFAGFGGREYLIDGETALIAEDGDCLNAAKKLIQLLENKNLKESLRENSKSIVNTHSLDCMKSKVIDFYTKINNNL